MRVDASADSRMLAVLRATFGYTAFRPLQADVVRSILRGQDVFVLMPTGGGKSLCYQLPALLLDGLTVVVSPLIALMKDQVDGLQALGVSATCINSSLDPAEIDRRQAEIARGDVKLLYVAPERLMLPGFLQRLASTRLAFFAIDEAHCISEWGHDFRPEYRELKRLRKVFPTVPLGAFTATATPRVRADIQSQLGLAKAPIFQGSFNRPNLYYEVRPKKAAYDQLVGYLRAHESASGIVYCLSRSGTESLAATLCTDGFRAAAYHAGLMGEERHRRQEAFIRDDLRIIVATIAFGMGIDKPDVRFVVHYDLPKSLEAYYQESGRAGRDGDPADCILFYSVGDVARHQYFIDRKESATERRIAQWQLQQMADWAGGLTCRRRALLAYFDEPFAGQSGDCCDLCRLPPQEVDATIPAQMFLSCAKRVGERFGVTHLIRVLRGSRDERILRAGHDQLSTYGIGRDRSRLEWRSLADELLRTGCIRLAADELDAVKVTPRGHAVLFKGEKVVMSAPRTFAAAEDESADQSRSELFDRLRVLRKRLADERGVPPYVIFHDGTLREMASRLLASREQLLRIQGVGERKAIDFGDAFLAEIAAFVRETGVRPTTGAPGETPGRGRGELSPTVAMTMRLFRAGHDIQEIAAARQLARSTVEGHLAEAIEVGEEVDLQRLVSPYRRHAIEAAIAELGSERLQPIKERLGDDYTYAEIRFVRAALAWR
ncbi:MAG: DNA helicase RecQ [Chloroflexi bacterium]|nr:DNA helicase RecQ [Chloroflexota bacterium]